MIPSMIEIIRPEDWKTVPWKNGGGVTDEIAVHPRGAGLDDFTWRLSMARVERGGAFSAFDGVDRSLAVLAGDGLLLSGVRAEPVLLTATDAPFAFAGEAPARADLPGAPVVDLNIMTRRRLCRHRMIRLAAGERHHAARPGLVLLVHSRSPDALVETAGRTLRLEQSHTLATDGPATIAAGGGGALVVMIRAQDACNLAETPSQ